MYTTRVRETYAVVIYIMYVYVYIEYIMGDSGQHIRYMNAEWQKYITSERSEWVNESYNAGTSDLIHPQCILYIVMRHWNKQLQRI